MTTAVTSEVPGQPQPPPQPARQPMLPAWVISGLILLYEAVELDLLRALAISVHRRADVTDVRQRLNVITTLEAKVSAITRRLGDRVGEMAPEMITHAMTWGDRVGLDAAREALGSDRVPAGVIDHSLIDRLGHELVDQLRPVNVVVRHVMTNANQRIHEQAAIEVATSDLHLYHAKQRLLTRFAQDGVTGFVDRRNRRWDLTAYAEMRVRTAAAQAALAAQLDRLVMSGIGLVYVPDRQRECELCRHWEGKVLTIAGPGGRSQQKIFVGGRLVTVDVAGSLPQARAAGLLHPNCSHPPAAYIPGVTKIPPPRADPQGYRDRQRLRALERQLRAAKRVEAVATTVADKTAARATVRRWQREIRTHVKETGMVRQVAREHP